jgi:hypothetical protein
MMKRITLSFIFLINFLCSNAHAEPFDHQHLQFTQILQQHVRWINPHETAVDYESLSQHKEALQRYLDQLRRVTYTEFNRFSKHQQLAFLINAYNAYTLSWVANEHEHINSIKDLGTLFKSPWKQKIFTLFGKAVSLDYIEHDLIRQPGRFDDPRIHMAVNCASKGCPALRGEAFTADKLNAQLDDGVSRFLSDKSRNRIEKNTIFVSKIFDWYESDFVKNSGSLLNWLRKNQSSLASNTDHKNTINGQDPDIKFLDYDWGLNRLEH